MASKYEELYQAALTGKLDRRQVLKRALALGLTIPAISALLAACADDEGDDGVAAESESDDSEEVEEPEDAEEEEEEPEEEVEEGEDDLDEPDEVESDLDVDQAEAFLEDDGWEYEGENRIEGPYEGEADTLNGAGATFPAVLYSRWFHEYEQLTGVRVNYQSIGSGGGIASISDQTVDFGATDGPMNDEQLEQARGGNIFHIPVAMGAVVPTYNIPELDMNEPLRFTADTLAGIYLGEITEWNDPALVEDNPQLEEIDQPILVVHRSDGSGTTFIFVDYLSAVSEEWAENVGVGTSVNWPVGIGGNGNEGVAGEVVQNEYSIGYVELIYALQNDLGVGEVQNQAGNFILPSTSSVTSAAAGFADSIDPQLRDRIVDAPGEDSYPISGFTWLLAYEDMDDEAKGLALTRMLWWCVTDAQRWNNGLGYARVPEEIVDLAKELIQDIKVDGEPIFPGE
jgi:phosphate transport system substrate-binding protein